MTSIDGETQRFAILSAVLLAIALLGLALALQAWFDRVDALRTRDKKSRGRSEALPTTEEPQHDERQSRESSSGT